MHITDQTTSTGLTGWQARVQVSAGIEARLEALRRFHLRKRLAELAVFTALWPCGAAAVLAAGYFLPPGLLRYASMAAGILIAAVALNAFVLLLHEGMHHTLFENAFWNRWVSVLLGAPLLISFSAYQVMHLRHHTFLGDPRDPDDYHNYSRSHWRVWLMHGCRLLFGAFLYLLLIPVLALRHGTAAERLRIAVEYGVLALIYTAVALTVPGDVLLLVWFIPVVLVGCMTNIRGFTQHGITDASDPFIASRTMKPHPLIAFCLLNENYHLEHHLFPEVPSYHLKELHDLIWPRLPRAVTGTSYIAFLVRFLRATVALDETPIGLTTPNSHNSLRSSSSASTFTPT
jgi:fatty acid desaturase